MFVLLSKAEHLKYIELSVKDFSRADKVVFYNILWGLKREIANLPEQVRQYKERDLVQFFKLNNFLKRRVEIPCYEKRFKSLSDKKE